MKGWFRNRPTKKAITGHSIFSRFHVSNYLLLVLFVCLHSAAHAQSKDSSNFTVISNYHNSVTIHNFTGNTMSLVYQTLPGNQAGDNHNSLWLWRSSTVPWNTLPMKMQPLPAEATESGSYVLEGISININTAYIACYSMDTTAQRISACSQLNAVGNNISESWASIELLNISANALIFKYQTLPGYLPATYGNWFGVWKGAASPYNFYPPISSGKPLDNSNSSTATLNNISFEANQQYTLVYFLGPDSTQAAAIITFQVH
jgi:hypothetical protein